MTTLFVLLFLIVFVEALTEIIVSSVIFEKPREFLAYKSDFLGELIHCGYCTSVWVSAAISWAFVLFVWSVFPSFLLSYIVTTFVLHRLSNLLHELNSKWLNRRPISFAVHKTETVIVPGVTDVQEPEDHPA